QEYQNLFDRLVVTDKAAARKHLASALIAVRAIDAPQERISWTIPVVRRLRALGAEDQARDVLEKELLPLAKDLRAAHSTTYLCGFFGAEYCRYDLPVALKLVEKLESREGKRYAKAMAQNLADLNPAEAERILRTALDDPVLDYAVGKVAYHMVG